MNEKDSPLKLTVTGPAGSGKGTSSRKLADRLRLSHIDGGFIFRFGAYCSLTGMIGCISGLARLHDERVWSYVQSTDGPYIEVEGRRLGRELRDPVIGMLAAESAAKPEFFECFRAAVEAVIGSCDRVIVDGRSAGTVILPHADAKFYITADVRIRAMRHQKLFAKSGFPTEIGKIVESIEARDRLDASRPIDPLRIPNGAIVINNGGMDEEETVNRMISVLSERGLL